MASHEDGLGIIGIHNEMNQMVAALTGDKDGAGGIGILDEKGQSLVGIGSDDDGTGSILSYNAGEVVATWPR
jgi:hypothetical protein